MNFINVQLLFCFITLSKMKRLLCLFFLCLFYTHSTSLSLKLKDKDPIKSRETVKFDFGWRFQLGGNNIAPCPESAFPKNLSGVECMGLRRGSSNNADDCRGECCADVMCPIWQYTDSQGCWIGPSSDCNHTSSSWVGGGRDTPAKPLPPPDSGPTSRDFDDSNWEIVDAPHDSIITGEYAQNGTVRGQAYLPKNITWYRKHFNLPAEWKGRIIWVYFEGVFRSSTTYLNGIMLHHEDSGYTSFVVRLDNCSSILFGDGKDNENVLTIWSTPNEGFSGWWYEGGGLYRHTYLVSADVVHIIPDGTYVAAAIHGTVQAHDPNDISKGKYVDAAVISVSSEVINDDTKEQKRTYQYTIFDADGKQVGNTMLPPSDFSAGELKVLTDSYTAKNVELWSPARPYLYTLQCELLNNADDGIITDSGVTDTYNITFGIRSTQWDPDKGFFINGGHFTWRGFNNHNDFAGVGVAVPDRINLFRAQSMRAVGANAWRMSHNPPIPVMLDIMDSIGVLVWDENREFGNNPIWVANQGNMVRRDRNHPSVMAWSFCNEGGCNPGDSVPVAKQFVEVSKEADPNRPVTANMIGDFGGALSSQIDLQGFSHKSGNVFDTFHQQFPKVPTIGSECCSCTTQRGEDFPDSSKFLLGNFNANCNKGQTESQLDRSYVVGCMVWTLFDYYGEPSFGWPHISSSFGSIDLAGFAKASAYWYRSWWLYNGVHNHSTGGIDVPLNPPNLINPDAEPAEDNPQDGYLVHIVEHWDTNDAAPKRTIHVYTNAPSAELFINGKSQGVKTLVWQGWAEWDGVTYESGNLTANAIDDKNAVVARHTRLTTSDPKKIIAMLDVPNTETGTGSALVLDGQDTGMVSAALLDSNGRVAHGSSLNITFSVTSGPGRIIGVGNGNPQCHEPNHATWRSAYHGLARAIVQVTEDHTTANRDRMIQIDSDGGQRTLVGDPRDPKRFLDDIVVQVSAEGVGTATVSIPTSTDPNDGVISTARKSRQ